MLNYKQIANSDIRISLPCIIGQKYFSEIFQPEVNFNFEIM